MGDHILGGVALADHDLDALGALLRALRLQPGDGGLRQCGFRRRPRTGRGVVPALQVEPAGRAQDCEHGREDQNQARTHCGSPGP